MRMGGSDPRGELSVAHDDLLVHDQARTMGGTVEVIEEEGRDVLARDVASGGALQPLLEHLMMQVGIQLRVHRQWVGHHETRCDVQRLAGMHDVRDSIRTVHGPVETVAGVREVEARKRRGPVADDPDVQRLESLQGGAHIEDRLHSRAHDRDRRRGEGAEVGGLIPAVPSLTMHASETTGGEDADARESGEMTRGGDGGRPAPTAGQESGQIPGADLGYVLSIGYLIELVLVEADADPAIEDGDRGRNRPSGANDVLDLGSNAEVLRAREAMADDRRLQSHHGATLGQRSAHLRMNLNGGRVELGEGGWQMWHAKTLLATENESMTPARELTLVDGGRVVTRLMSNADGPALRVFHESLSERTVYLRFFGVHPHLSDADVEYFTHLDHSSREAVVAVRTGSGVLTTEEGPDAQEEVIVGVGRFDILESGYAEVAFVVTDACQGQGVGRLILDELIELARRRGVRAFTAEILPGNSRMLDLLTGTGLPIRREHEDGVVFVTLVIDEFSGSPS